MSSCHLQLPGPNCACLHREPAAIYTTPPSTAVLLFRHLSAHSPPIWGTSRSNEIVESRVSDFVSYDELLKNMRNKARTVVPIPKSVKQYWNLHDEIKPLHS